MTNKTNRNNIKLSQFKSGYCNSNPLKDSYYVFQLWLSDIANITMDLHEHFVEITIQRLLFVMPNYILLMHCDFFHALFFFMAHPSYYAMLFNGLGFYRA
jgi:hypothetical protein